MVFIIVLSPLDPLALRSAGWFGDCLVVDNRSTGVVGEARGESVIKCRLSSEHAQ